MPPVRLLALAVALIISSPLALLPAAGAGAGAAPAPAAAAAPIGALSVPPLGLGDWVVAGTEALRDRTVVLDGCLTIENGGELTLYNSTLIVKCAFSEEHWIRVEAGGILRVVNGSTVAGFNPDYHFIFWGEPGAQVEFKDSNFVSAGEQVRYLSDQLGSNDPDYSTVIGGIVLMTGRADIERCVFTGMPIALTLLKTEGVLRSCTFRDNFVGVLSHNANWTFENCTFERNTMGEVLYTKIGAGAWSWRSQSVFWDCSFSDGYSGIAIDNATCTATGCSFLRNVVGGTYVCGFMSYENPVGPGPCGPSSATVVDCEFIENVYGIARGIEGWLGPEELHIVNGIFRDNEVCGIWWENRLDPNAHYGPAWPWDGKPRATWNVTGRSEVSDKLLIFNGSIDVDSGGSLALCRTVLRMDCGAPGENGLRVRSGGSLAIANGSALIASDPKWPYWLACRPGSALVLNESRLRDCGWDPASPAAAGPYVEGGCVTVIGSVVDNCPVGLSLHGAAFGRVAGSRLDGRYLAARLDNSSLELVNSTAVSSGAMSAAVLNGSEMDCLNSSFDEGAAVVGGEGSRLWVGWYLDLLARYSDGRPAAGASVAARDASGAEVLNLSADGRGRADGLVLWEAVLTERDRTELSPHRVEVRSGGIANTTQVTADRSRSVTVMLEDSSPPSVSIGAPAAGALLNSGAVAVSGTAQDGLALGSVVLTVDGFERQTLLRDQSGALGRMDWNVTLALAEGPHTVTVAAADTTGNLAFASVGFSVDLTSPRVVILSPSEGFLTNGTEVAVSGVMETGCRVTVNGVEARNLGPTFSAVVRLSEGLNLIVAQAVDAAGNINTSSVTVRSDTTPPRLDVAFSPDALYVNRAQVNLSGTMEFGAFVAVDGRTVVLPGLAGDFSTTVFLSPGENTVRVRATDEAGNVDLLERRFVLDTSPPAFRVLFPPDGHQTNEPLLTILLVAEAGTEISAGAGARAVPGAPGVMVNLSLDLALSEGDNALLIRAADLAGNTFSVGRAVLLDTRAPALALSSPADGYRTSNVSVYVIGATDPGASVTVNGRGVDVGQEGAFSLELVLKPGRNQVMVNASDALGTLNSVTLNVTRVPGQAAEELVAGPGPDWLFWGFLAAAVSASSAEGWWLWRRPRRPAPREGPAQGGA